MSEPRTANGDQSGLHFERNSHDSSSPLGVVTVNVAECHTTIIGFSIQNCLAQIVSPSTGKATAKFVQITGMF